MARQLLTIIASTDGQNTSGQCKLYSSLFAVPADFIVVPLGMKLRIWQKRMTGAVDTEFKIEYTNDITPQFSGQEATWTTISVDKYLSSQGEVNIGLSKPIEVFGRTGREAIRVTWSQSTAGFATLELEVEITDED